jgi:hypothetical protein
MYCAHPQEFVGERVIEVLPNLRIIFLQDLQESELVPEVMRQFIATRQQSPQYRYRESVSTSGPLYVI